MAVQLFLSNFVIRTGPAAHGACLTGGQVAVVAVGQVDANFLADKHLEPVHCLTRLGNIDLVVIGIAHIHSLRSHSLAKVEKAMNGECRKQWERLHSV